MQHTIRPLIGVRHYHIPRIEYRIPPLPDYIRYWGGKTPDFNLLGRPNFAEAVEGQLRIFLRRRGVGPLVLSQKQQSWAIAFCLFAGISWRVYPLAFFLLNALVGVSAVAYRNLARCERLDPQWKPYRLFSFYSALLFGVLSLFTLLYLRIAF